MTTSSILRFTKGNPCPICGGGDNDKRGQGRRCHGFLSSDGEYAHCSRDAHAGSLPLEANSGTYAHRLVGDCNCGTRHDTSLAPAPTVKASTKARIVAAYDYHAADGTLAYQVVRREPKGFSQRRPDGQGGWIHNLTGVERVLYGLPALLAADPATPVYVVEGEKDADALIRLGCLATTNAGGAKKWQAAYGEVLRGRPVVILPDNDEAGKEHGEMVARALLGLAASVRVMTLPNLPDRGDVSDWLRHGGTVTDLEALVAATPLVDARFAPKAGSTHRANDDSAGFKLTILADLLAEPMEEAEWVVEGLLPTAGTSLITAKPKVGKTTLVRNLALAVSRGEPFLGRTTKQGSVLYLALEEKRGKVQEHFASLGATITDHAPLFVHVGSAPAMAIEELAALMAEHRPVLVIIDPLQRFVRLRDGNDYSEVTRVMEPLNALARNSEAHIVFIHHANKGGYGGGDSVLGSTGFFAAVDTLITLRRDGEDRTIETDQRYGENLAETTLAFDKATGHIGLSASLGEQHRRDVAADIKAAIRAGLHEEAAIRERVGGDRTVVSRELRVLIESGEVSRSGDGKKGHPYRYDLAEENNHNQRPPTILDAPCPPIAASDHRAIGGEDADDTDAVTTWVG